MKLYCVCAYLSFSIMYMFILFVAYCLKHSYSIISTNEIKTNEILKILSFFNSSSYLNKISFVIDGKSYIGSVSYDSNLIIKNSVFEVNVEVPALFESCGRISLNKVNLVTDQISNLRYSSITSFPSMYSNSVSICKTPSLIMLNSAICDIINEEHEGDFLSLGYLYEEVVEGCIFSNITRGRIATRRDLLSSVSLCRLTGTIMKGVEDFIYGGIISGLSCLSTKEMVCSNCSFEKCFRENKVRYSKMNKNKREDNSNNYLNNSLERKNDISQINIKFTDHQEIIGEDHGSYNYTNCSFTGCDTSSEDGGGGLFFFSKDHELRLVNMTFTSCSADSGYGGGFCCKNLSYLLLEHCSFANCSAENGGGMCVRDVPKVRIIKFCNYSDCSCTNNGGSVYYANSNLRDSEDSYAGILSCGFYNSNADNDGGGLYLEPLYQTKPRDLFLQNCHAGGHSGGIDFKLRDKDNHNETLFYFLLFINCSSTSEGNDLVLRSKDLTNINNPFYSCYTMSNLTGRFYFASGSESSWNYVVMDDLVINNYSRSMLYKPSVDIENLSCGATINVGCNSLSKGIKDIINGSVNIFFCQSNVNYYDKSLTYEKYIYVYHGIKYDSDLDKSSLYLRDCDEEKPYFNILSGKLYFYYIEWHLDTRFHQPLFNIASGTFVMFNNSRMEGGFFYSYTMPLNHNLFKFQNCTIYDPRYEDHSFFDTKLESNYFEINNVTFDNLDKNKGKGAVLYLALNETQKLSMINVTMLYNGIKKENGYGYAFYVVLPECEQLTFEDCNFHLGGCGAENIYCIVHKDLHALAKYLNNTDGVFIDSMYIFYAMGCYEENEEYVPLILLLRDDLTMAYVQYNGFDDIYCGHHDYTCRTLTQAFNNLKPEKKIVEIRTGLSMNQELILDKYSYNVTVSNYMYDIIDINRSTIITSVETNFEKIRFKFASNRDLPEGSGEPPPMFKCIDSNLTFKTASLDEIYSDYINHHIIIVSGKGHLFMLDANFTPNKRIVANAQPIFIDEGGSANLTQVRVLSWEAWEDRNGTIICASIGKDYDVYINNCSFSTIKNLKGRGGVMYFHVREESPGFGVINSSFFETECDIGAYMYFLCENGSFTPHLSQFEGVLVDYSESFEKLYWDESISPNINSSLLHYLFPPYYNPSISSIFIVGKEKGVRTEGCGWEDVPCENFVYPWSITNRLAQFVVCGETEIEESLESPERIIDIKGNKEEQEYENLLFTSALTRPGFIVNRNFAYLDFSKLHFKRIDCAISFFGASSGSLSVHDCSFSSPITASIISVIPPPQSSSILSLSVKSLSLPSDNNMSLITLDSSDSQGSSENIRFDIYLDFEESNKNPVILLSPITCTVTLSGNISCSSEGSTEGGAVKACLRDGGSFNLFSLSVLDCKASKKEGENGKGGFLFLDCVDPALKDVNVESLPAASFLAHSTTFSNNDAAFGRDIFMYCYSINSQVNLNMFLIDFGTNFNSVNALYGCDAKDINITSEYVDILRTKEYLSEHIYISSLKIMDEDLTICGTESNPCNSVDQGYKHTLSQSYNSLTVISKTFIKQSFSMVDVTVQKSKKDKEKPVIYLDDNYEGRDTDEFILSLSSKVTFNDVLFSFSSSLICSCETFIKTLDVMLVLSNINVEGSKEVNYGFHFISSSTDSVINITSLVISSFFTSSSLFIFSESVINIIDVRINDSFVNTGSIIETVEELNTTIMNLTLSNTSIKEGNIINSQCNNNIFLYNLTVSNVSIETGNIIQSNLFNSMSLAHMKVYDIKIEKGSIINIFCNGNFDVDNITFYDIILNNGNVIEMKEESANRKSEVSLHLMTVRNITLKDPSSSYISSSSSSVVAFFSSLSFYSPVSNKNNGSIINWKAGTSSFQTCIFSGKEMEEEEEKESRKGNNSYIQSVSNYKSNNIEYVNEDECCSFEDGILLFKGGKANFDDVSFKNFTLCAVKVENAEVNIVNGEFENNAG